MPAKKANSDGVVSFSPRLVSKHQSWVNTQNKIILNEVVAARKIGDGLARTALRLMNHADDYASKPQRGGIFAGVRWKVIPAPSGAEYVARRGRPERANAYGLARCKLDLLGPPVALIDIFFYLVTFMPVFQGFVGMMFGLAKRVFLASDYFAHGFNCLHHDFSSRLDAALTMPNWEVVKWA